jgi:transcriptional regulator with XRE-family HTH domain
MDNTYSNVPDMLRALLPEGGDKLAKKVEKSAKEYSIGDSLIRTRLKAGLTQKQIAAKLGCTQSKISKIECAHNDDMRISDFVKYIGACGCDVSIMVSPHGENASTMVKHHAVAMGMALDKLADIASKDGEIADAIRKFHSEVLYNLGYIMSRWTDKLFPNGIEPPVDPKELGASHFPRIIISPKFSPQGSKPCNFEQAV